MVAALASSAIPPAFLPASGVGQQVNPSSLRNGGVEKASPGGTNQDRTGAEENEDEAAVAGFASSQEDGPPLDVIMADEGSVQTAADPGAGSRLPTFKTQDDEEVDAPAAATPSLDSMVERIPPAVRETLDELFRARFVKVVRVPKSALASDRKATA